MLAGQTDGGIWSQAGSQHPVVGFHLCWLLNFHHHFSEIVQFVQKNTSHTSTVDAITVVHTHDTITRAQIVRPKESLWQSPNKLRMARPTTEVASDLKILECCQVTLTVTCLILFGSYFEE